MTVNEKLIEEAAKAIMEASHGQGVWELREPMEEELYLRRARAALVVFEKAHTPTDDEREALRAEAEKVQRAAWAEIHGQDPQRTYSVAEVKRIVYSFDNVLSSALRRSEVPEPSAEAEFAPGECDGSGTCSASVHIHGCYTRHRADQCDAPEEYGHLPSEPQGEPSDAQVDERGRHWWACAVNAPRADWVGPCDCDLSRDPSLTEHPAALRAARVGGAQ